MPTKDRLTKDRMAAALAVVAALIGLVLVFGTGEGARDDDSPAGGPSSATRVDDDRQATAAPVPQDQGPQPDDDDDG
ncbi:hypothetical protein [Pseudonocardia sp. HH130629-09]|uniref:hypothetical protein n=1 Tax=Pseudonocardia sp. HH130629-09 TaxID=1641402 RepID=UPI0006CB702D|nr:hypothetical protein [Pseudonocardia sp. HH130629-09]ALE84155.1 hypothetical protein XF36_14270 [Pseudonocardia sp. HH130629-09]